MPRVTFSDAAPHTLNADPMVRRWKADAPRDSIPMLHYYRRLYFTAHDGTITEHGDGFNLTFVDPHEEQQPHIAGYVRVPLGDGHDIVVEVHTDHAASFMIGRSRTRYTYEPRT